MFVNESSSFWTNSWNKRFTMVASLSRSPRQHLLSRLREVAVCQCNSRQTLTNKETTKFRTTVLAYFKPRKSTEFWPVRCHLSWLLRLRFSGCANIGEIRREDWLKADSSARRAAWMVSAKVPQTCPNSIAPVKIAIRYESNSYKALNVTPVCWICWTHISHPGLDGCLYLHLVCIEPGHLIQHKGSSSRK